MQTWVFYTAFCTGNANQTLVSGCRYLMRAEISRSQQLGNQHRIVSPNIHLKSTKKDNLDIKKATVSRGGFFLCLPKKACLFVVYIILFNPIYCQAFIFFWINPESASNVLSS